MWSKFTCWNASKSMQNVNIVHLASCSNTESKYHQAKYFWLSYHRKKLHFSFHKMPLHSTRTHRHIIAQLFCHATKHYFCTLVSEKLVTGQWSFVVLEEHSLHNACHTANTQPRLDSARANVRLTSPNSHPRWAVYVCVCLWVSGQQSDTSGHVPAVFGRQINEGPWRSLWARPPLEALNDLRNTLETLSDTFIMTKCFLAETPPTFCQDQWELCSVEGMGLLNNFKEIMYKEIYVLWPKAQINSSWPHWPSKFR